MNIINVLKEDIGRIEKHHIRRSMMDSMYQNYYQDEASVGSDGRVEICTDLLERFKDRLEREQLPANFGELNPKWQATFELDENGARLCCEPSPDEGFDTKPNTSDRRIIMCEERAHYLDLEDYAKLHAVKDSTVKQWIRRGKLRNARKLGGYWQISELAQVQTGRYSRCTYFWNEPAGSLDIDDWLCNDKYFDYCDLPNQYLNVMVRKKMLEFNDRIYHMDHDSNEEGVSIEVPSKVREQVEYWMV